MVFIRPERYFQFFSCGKEIIVRQQLRSPFPQGAFLVCFLLCEQSFDLLVRRIRHGRIQHLYVQSLCDFYRLFHGKCIVHIKDFYEIAFFFVEQHHVLGGFVAVRITALRQKQCGLHSIDLDLFL